ncbi:MAG: hypothetical protein WCT10_00520 [Patescibacteria group bacterium]|jgi:hypothetical protein
MKKHTLVAHLSPDLEVLFMIHLIRSDERVRERLDVEDCPALKFIPAGPLSADDWSKTEMDLTVEELEARGYLFLDCGGGLLDQHGKQSLLRNSMSSLDLLVHYAEIDKNRPELLPIVSVISQNDLSGQDIVRDQKYRQSQTPHTPRHLRNVVLGWNLMYFGYPEYVVALANTAFCSIGRLLVEKHLNGDRDIPMAEVRQLFLADEIVHGAFSDLAFGEAGGFDTSAAEKESVEFREEVEAGLDAMEKEWDLGARDYLKRTKIVRTAYSKEVEGATVCRQIAIVYGSSDSSRFGAVTRFGNESQGHRGRPYRQIGERPKADVTIQFYGPGRFLVSTKGIELGKVAAAIRRLDLVRKGVKLDEAQQDQLGNTGHLMFTNSQNAEVQAMYLAEYRTAFGNAFRANPRAAAVALTEDEIVDLTIKALSGSK